jgi:hypothetical protein
MQTKTRTRLAVLAMILLAAPWAAAQLSSPSTSNAANKTQVSGSGIDFLGPSVGPNDSAVTTATVLATTIKTSTPEDLVFQITLECALWSSVTTVGNDMAQSTARVLVWVELDGQPVAVSSDDTQDVGRVVFCDRVHQQKTSGFDDQNATIQQYLATRSANAFNWVSLNVGSGFHTIAVKAQLSGDTVGMATAQAGIGNRMLIVEPTKLAHGATL